MNKFLIPILLMFIASKPLTAQEVSLASILETRVSVSIDANGIADSVHELVEATRAELPELQELKFFFEDTQKFQTTPKHRMVFKKEKIRRIFDLIGIAYRHDVHFDLLKRSVTFVAAKGGEDSNRKYRFSEELSKQLSLDWSDEAHAVESILKHGVIANAGKLDIRDRSIVLKGRQAELDYFDMVIVVYRRK